MIPHSDSPRFTCSFSTGGLGLAVECDDASLMDGLRQRYRQFSECSAVSLKVCVHLTGKLRDSALLDRPALFVNGVFRFTAPGYEGFIDERQGEGNLMLSSAQPLDDVDYFLRVACALLAFHAGGLLLHAAGIVRDGRGHVFFGHSGSGKTTVARLSSDAVVLNDDLLLLMPSEHRQGWTVYSTPFWNPTQVSPAGSLSAPLADMFRLVQDQTVYQEEMEPGQALAELVTSVPVIPADPTRLVSLLERGNRLVSSVPIFKLHFLPDASFWDVITSHI